MGQISSLFQENPNIINGEEQNAIEEIDVKDITLFENIGWGISGVIRRGKWREKDVAVKLLFPESSNAEKLKTAINKTKSIKHENIVTIYGASYEPKNLSIIMEYIQYGSLKTFIHKSRNKQFNWIFLYRISIDISRAMIYLHQNKIIHFHLNPSTVLINSTSAVGNEPVVKIVFNGTEKGKGSVGYMAPELVERLEKGAPSESENITEKVDVYAFAIILWEILTREQPFVDDLYVIDKIKSGIRPEIPEFCPNSISELIKQCWEQDPNARPSFTEIYSRLLQLGSNMEQFEKIITNLSETTDSEGLEFNTKKWEETTFTDIDEINQNQLRVRPTIDIFPTSRQNSGNKLKNNVPVPPSPSDTDDKESFTDAEQEIVSPPLSPKESEEEQDVKTMKPVLNGPSASAPAITISPSEPVPDFLKKKKRRVKNTLHQPTTRKKSKKRSSTLPNSFAQGGTTLKTIETIIEAEEKAEQRKRQKKNIPSIKVREAPIRIPDQLGVPVNNSRATRAKSEMNEANIDKLRLLSKARSNLHQLLVNNEFEENVVVSNSSEKTMEDSKLIINMLRASLEQEVLKVQLLKKQNELLTNRLDAEQKHRKELKEKLFTTKKELHHRSLTLAGPIDALQFQKSSFVFDEDAYQITEEKEKQPERMKWCELHYQEIAVQSSPYLYTPFAIWYKATWQSYPMRFCVVIGGIHNELVTKFRKFSTFIQQLSNHPNICNLMGIVSQAPNFGILIRVPENSVELGELLQLKKLSVKDKLYIARTVAFAIHHCHSNGRSVAWLNNRSIFVDTDNLHTQIVHTCNLHYFSQANIDTDWEKYRWQAPEIFYGRIRSSISSDCYSLGLILYYIFSETLPYGEHFTPGIAEKVISGWRIPFPLDFPNKIRDIVVQCWCKKPEDRISSKAAGELIHQLYESEEI